jgi:hypothetical protein
VTRIWRLQSPSDDRGSIPMAMLIVLIGTMLAALVGTLVLSQVASTRVDLRRVHALHAAQAGLDVAVGHIRAIATTTGSDRTKLPCGTLTGSLGNGSTAVYRTTVDYYLGDPQNKDQAWLTTNRLRCNPGTGTGAVPGYAYLVSTGADQPTTSFTDVPTRTVNGTYTFRLDNRNVVGGLIHIANDGGADLCLDAGVTPALPPDAPTAVLMQRCVPNKASQMFAYNDNLTLSLVGSGTGRYPLGMCLEYSSTATPPVPVSSAAVVFKPCANPTAQPQRWTFDDSSFFRATYANGTYDNNSLCMYALTPRAVNSSVVLQSCGSGSNVQKVFKQDFSVGAGAAGTATGQLINFRQFGRCLDITNHDLNNQNLIAWPCKTSVNTNGVSWNQKFTLPVPPDGAKFKKPDNFTTGVIRSGSANDYCMSSPGQTTVGSYVRFNVKCPLTGVLIPQNQRWTVYGKTDSYSTSYQIVDGFGFCLQPRDQNATTPDYFDATNKVMKIYVGPCDGSTLQKWNADPNDLNMIRLKDLDEK